jgi:hypothetical protein
MDQSCLALLIGSIETIGWEVLDQESHGIKVSAESQV